MTLALGIFNVVIGYDLISSSDNLLQTVIGLGLLGTGSIFIGLELSK